MPTETPMKPPTPCPRCGSPLTADAPEGLCPRCLLEMNLRATTQFPGEPAGSAATAPAPATIADKFPQLEILECLGRGGMGVVYKARQPRLNRLVALKILAPEKEKDPQFAERFTREAQALARLNHPNIVTVYDFGETDGLYYLLMEYVDGVTLRQLLAAGKVVPEQALAIVPRICEALQYAHEQGIVHRDIKPENVLLDKQGRVKIADFGIAKLLGEQGGSAAFYTKGRMVVGTPYYMAPEQVENPLQVDHRADIYSLGVVFYEMLTGELPLGRFELPSQKVQIDVRLDEVVLHALEKQPARRYQQASEVKTDLETIAGTGAKAAGGVDKTAAGAGALPKKGSSGTWKVVGIVAAVVLISLMALMALAVVFLGFSRVSHNVALQEARQAQVAAELSKRAAVRQMQQDQLQAAEDALALAQKKADAGLITTAELQAAKDQVAVVKAQIGGDATKIAQAQLTAAQNQLRYVEQQYQAGLVTRDAEQVARRRVQQLQDNLTIQQLTKVGGGQSGANGPPVPAALPDAANPLAAPAATAVSPPVAPEPLPAPDAKAGVEMMQEMMGTLSSIRDATGLEQAMPEFQKWQALLRGTPEEPVANATLTFLAMARSVFQQPDPQAAQNSLGGLMTQWWPMQQDLQSCIEQPSVSEVQVAGVMIRLLWAQLNTIQFALGGGVNVNADNWDDMEQAMEKNIPVALDLWKQAEPLFQTWQAMYQGTSAEKVATAVTEQFNEIGAYLRDGQASMALAQVRGLYSAQDSVRESLDSCGGAQSLSNPEVGIAMMGPLDARLGTLQEGEYIVGRDLASAAKQGAVAMELKLLDRTKTAFDAWQAMFQGTPAEKVTAAAVQQLGDVREAWRQGQFDQSELLLNALGGLFESSSAKVVYGGEVPDHLNDVLPACVSNPSAISMAALAGWTILLQMHYDAVNSALPKGGDTDATLATTLLEQSAVPLADWKKLLEGTPAEQAAAITAGMADDLKTALGQNQIDHARVLSGALNAQLTNFVKALHGLASQPNITSAAFAAGLTERMRASFQNFRRDLPKADAAYHDIELLEPQFAAWQSLLRYTGAIGTADDAVKQLADLRDAILQNQTLPAQALASSLSDNLGLAQAQLLSEPPPPTPDEMAAQLQSFPERLNTLSDAVNKGNDPTALSQAQSLRDDFDRFRAPLDGTAAGLSAMCTDALFENLILTMRMGQTWRAGPLANALKIFFVPIQQAIVDSANVPNTNLGAAATAMLPPLRAWLWAVSDNAYKDQSGSSFLLNQSWGSFETWQAVLAKTPAKPIADAYMQQLTEVRDGVQQKNPHVGVLLQAMDISFPWLGKILPEFANKASAPAPETGVAMMPALYARINVFFSMAPGVDPALALTFLQPAKQEFDSWQTMFNGTAAAPSATAIAQMVDEIIADLKQADSMKAGYLDRGLMGQFPALAEALHGCLTDSTNAKTWQALATVELMQARFHAVEYALGMPENPNQADPFGSGNAEAAADFATAASLLATVQPTNEQLMALLKGTPAEGDGRFASLLQMNGKNSLSQLILTKQASAARDEAKAAGDLLDHIEDLLRVAVVKS